MKSLLSAGALLLLLSLIVFVLVLKSDQLQNEESSKLPTTESHDIDEAADIESPVDTITMEAFQNDKIESVPMTMSQFNIAGMSLNIPADTVIIDSVEYVLDFFHGTMYEVTLKH